MNKKEITCFSIEQNQYQKYKSLQNCSKTKYGKRAKKKEKKELRKEILTYSIQTIKKNETCF